MAATGGEPGEEPGTSGDPSADGSFCSDAVRLSTTSAKAKPKCDESWLPCVILDGQESSAVLRAIASRENGLGNLLGGLCSAAFSRSRINRQVIVATSVRGAIFFPSNDLRTRVLTASPAGAVYSSEKVSRTAFIDPAAHGSGAVW
jgi:hypothetical protein